MSQDPRVLPPAFPDAPLTLRESAAFLKCSQRTIQRLVERGLLKAYKVGRNHRFFHRDLLVRAKTSPLAFLVGIPGRTTKVALADGQHG